VGLVVAFYAAPVVHELPQLNLFAVGDTIDTKVLVLSSSYLPATIWFPDSSLAIYTRVFSTLPNSIESNLLCLAISNKENFVVDYSVNGASTLSGDLLSPSAFSLSVF
jgi:hypothetical protein